MWQDELSRIGDTISNLLIDDDYKLDDTLEWTEQIDIYIMRYRRIIGIMMLVILLWIMRYCNWSDSIDVESRLQTGGGNNALAAAELAKLRATDTAQKMFAEEQAASAKAEAKAAEQKSKDERTQQIADAKAAKKEARKTGRREFTKTQLTKMGKDISESASKSKLGQLATGKLADIEEMKSAGMSKFGIAKNLGGQAGQFAADKFKQFAGWLYEILFAIAISIAICMIVIPSIAFFALGLICYFLLRKKLATMKAF